MKTLAIVEKIFNAIMATFLALMGILVFGNVILRYFFNSGIPWAEEVSRFLFVWIVFLGAIGALKDNNHLGFTSLVQKLPRKLKMIVFVISNALVLGSLWVLFQGSLEMTTLTAKTVSPTAGIPLSYEYGVGIISSIGMFLIVGYNLYRALFKGEIDKMVILKESEEELL